MLGPNGCEDVQGSVQLVEFSHLVHGPMDKMILMFKLASQGGHDSHRVGFGIALGNVMSKESSHVINHTSIILDPENIKKTESNKRQLCAFALMSE